MTAFAQLFKLIDDYGAENIRTGLVQHWARRSGIGLGAFKSKSITQKILERANSSEMTLLLNQFGVLFPKITLKDVEKSFELTLSKEQRKSFGVVYTPEYIIDYLTQNAFQFARLGHKKAPKLCDPCCGSGGFLVRMAEILATDFGIAAERAFSELIFGIDINAQALEQANCLIELYLASKNQPIPDLNHALLQLDTLTASAEQIYASANLTNGFDVVVTNPPYVKFQNLSEEYRRLLISRCNGLANGNFSLSSLFLAKGFDLLSPGGSLGMITQNNLFTSLAGQTIREHVQKHECLRRVIDFGQHKIFENASAYTCLIFLGKEKSLQFEYASVNQREELNLSLLEKLTFSKLSLLQLKPGKWRLGKDAHLQNLKKIETMGKPLKEMASIKVGFATLKDAVFFARESNGVCLATSPHGAPVHIEREITRPAVKISELKSAADLANNNRRIIFPYIKENGAYQLIPEQDLQHRFPGAYAHLSAFREILEAREKSKKKYAHWYAWARTQGMEAPAPKLLTKTFSRFPQFLLDTTGQLFCNGYSVSAKPPTMRAPSPPIEFLAKILNSRIMDYYAKLTSFQLQGGYQCYQKNFIERFGIPLLDCAAMNEFIALSQNEADKRLACLYHLNFDEILEITDTTLKEQPE